MLNLETKKREMAKMYNSSSYTHNYGFGFNMNNKVVLSVVYDCDITNYCKLDMGSRNSGYSLRFIPNKELKSQLMENAVAELCSVEEFEEMVKSSRYNAGEIFEKLVTEYYGQVWEKDNIPYTEAGDIEVNGIAYQIKYNRATFATEKSLKSLVR